MGAIGAHIYKYLKLTVHAVSDELSETSNVTYLNLGYFALQRVEYKKESN